MEIKFSLVVGADKQPFLLPLNLAAISSKEKDGKVYEVHYVLEVPLICPECKGVGEVDSGGVESWGAPVYIGCPICEGSGKVEIIIQGLKNET